jgi:GDSL-like Lipase/Acylhydrolase
MSYKLFFFLFHSFYISTYYFFQKNILITTKKFIIIIIYISLIFVITGLKYGLKVCCGASGQGQYNYNNNARCGMSGSSSCPDPHNYLIWDGIHLTEAAYRAIADGWLKGPYCSPAILG